MRRVKFGVYKTKFVSYRNVEGNCNALSSTFYQINFASRSDQIYNEPKTLHAHSQTHPLKDIFYSHILAIVLLQPREPNARFIDGTKSYHNEKIVQPNQLF